MKTKILIAGLLLTVSQTAYGFGHKKMNLTEVKGVTETQLVKSADAKKLSVMVRGRAAELLYRTLDEKKIEQQASDALELVGSTKSTHWTVKGKQVVCSRIQNQKNKKKEDYACAFDLDPKGEVAGEVEPFNPAVFNLSRTKTQAKIFQKKSGRALASVMPAGPYEAAAYVMYDAPNKAKKEKPEYEDALIVFKGSAASEIMGFLTESKSYKEFLLAGAKGLKGKEISCVEAKDKEPARCALVVSLKSGSVSTRKNPLFR